MNLNMRKWKTKEMPVCPKCKREAHKRPGCYHNGIVAGYVYYCFTCDQVVDGHEEDEQNTLIKEIK
jgi:ribosomal protein L37AE/L43A